MVSAWPGKQTPYNQNNGSKNVFGNSRLSQNPNDHSHGEKQRPLSKNELNNQANAATLHATRTNLQPMRRNLTLANKANHG